MTIRRCCSSGATVAALLAWPLAGPAAALRHREGGGIQPRVQCRPGRSQGLVLVGAGLPRTGTESLRLALHELGYCVASSGHLYQNATAKFIWDTGNDDVKAEWLMSRGFEATVDGPYNDFYPKWLERFPESKAIFTVHPRGEDAWVRSVHKQAKAIAMDNNIFKDFQYVDQLPGCRVPTHGDLPEGVHEACAAAYRKYNDEVRRSVPPERLLEYKVTDGWGPLCKFLGKPVPDVPFPRDDWTTKYFPKTPAVDGNAAR